MKHIRTTAVESASEKNPSTNCHCETTICPHLEQTQSSDQLTDFKGMTGNLQSAGRDLNKHGRPTDE